MFCGQSLASNLALFPLPRHVYLPKIEIIDHAAIMRRCRLGMPVIDFNPLYVGQKEQPQLWGKLGISQEDMTPGDRGNRGVAR